MKASTKILLGIWFVAALFACNKGRKPVPNFSISKIFKTDTLTTVDVHISHRMTAAQLTLIADKLKTDSAQLNNLVIHYLLPGNTDLSAGEHSFYALLRYLKAADIKQTDSLKDANGKSVRLQIFGLDSLKARTLLDLQPDVLTGKMVAGEFIDDYDHTLIIPFKDPTDKKDELFVIELNAMGTIVSSTVPQKKVEDGVEKWMVDKNGDYITIKDSVLTQYSADGLGVPFNSIKAGI